MDRFDDQELVRSARGGDQQAFARLISRHYPALLNACRRMLAGQDLAGDAAQEATVRAMLGLDHLRDDARFAPWLIGIGLNVCRGWLTNPDRFISLDASGRGAAVELVSDAADPLEIIASAELTARVRAAIAGLPSGQRHAVAMFYLTGLTHAETAAELATRPGAIKTRLHKARRSLRVQLHDTYKEYIAMPHSSPSLIPMRIVELRRARSRQSDIKRHILFLQDDQGRRLRIWIGPAEAIQMALLLEQVELPRPGVYQFAASLLTAAGADLQEVRITALTETTFIAEAVLNDQTRVDARPSDALTLALVTGAPIYVSTRVLEQAARRESQHRDLVDEADAATDTTSDIAQDAIAVYQKALVSAKRPQD